jgi:thioredoxin 1
MELKILDFMSTWCSPCRTMSPILDEVEKETGVEIRKIDVDDNEEMVIAYGIRNIPTLIFIKDNQIVDRVSGSVRKEILINKINEYSK